MTTIIFDVDVDTREGYAPAPGALEFAPIVRRVEGAKVVREDGFTVEVPAAQDTFEVELAPTSEAWCWRIRETSAAARSYTRYVLVPDSNAPVNYTDLVDVDPHSFEPGARPPARWESALGEHVAASDAEHERLDGRITALEGRDPGEGGSHTSDADVAGWVADDDAATARAVDDRIGAAGHATTATVDEDRQASEDRDAALRDALDAQSVRIDSKADAEHTHTTAQVDGLDEKQDEQDAAIQRAFVAMNSRQPLLKLEQGTRTASFDAEFDTHYHVDASLMSRVVFDGITNKDTTRFRSATAKFTAADAGVPVTGHTIPRGTVISSVTSEGEVQLSRNAGDSGNAIMTIGPDVLTVTLPPTNETVEDGARVRIEKVGTNVKRVLIRTHPDSSDTIRGTNELIAPGSVCEWRVDGDVWHAEAVAPQPLRPRGTLISSVSASTGPQIERGTDATAVARRRAGGMHYPESWLTHAVLASEGRLRKATQSGVAGRPVHEIAHRFASTVLDRETHFVVIDPSYVNSANADFNFTATEMVNYVRTMAEQTVAFGAVPVLMTSYPINPNDATGLRRTDAYRQQVIALAGARGWPVWDSHGAVYDVATRTWMDGLHKGDFVHPTAYGCRALGESLWWLLTPWVGGSPARPQTVQHTSTTDGASSSLLTNGLFSEKQDNGLPTGWSKSGGGVVFESRNDDDAFLGNHIRVTDTGDAALTTITSGRRGDNASVGGKLITFVGLVRVVGTGRGDCVLSVEVNSPTAPVRMDFAWGPNRDANGNAAGGSRGNQTTNTTTTDTYGSQVPMVCRAPADATGVTVSIAAYGGDGLDMRFGQFRIDATN